MFFSEDKPIETKFEPKETPQDICKKCTEWEVTTYLVKNAVMGI